MDLRLRARLPYLAVAALCGLAGLYLAVSRGGEVKLLHAGEDVRAGRHAQALAELDGLGGQASGRAAVSRGWAYLGRRQYDRAAAEFSAATLRAPNDWVLQRDYAIVLRRLGRREKARARMQRALELNPRMLLPRGFRAAAQQNPPRRRG